MSDLEYRVAIDSWPEADTVVRAVEMAPDDPLTGLRFTGYAAVFDSPSEPLPGPRGPYRETIAPGAFTKTLSERGRTVKAFWNHNTDIPLASARAAGPFGTLTLSTDKVGLRTELVFLPEHREYAALVAAGVADSMSFGFNVDGESGVKWNATYTERELRAVRLHEVSVVSGWPAYTATSATVRALAEASDTDPDLLALAFSALRDPDGRLTHDQRRALIAAIDARSDLPVISHRAKWRERLDAIA